MAKISITASYGYFAKVEEEIFEIVWKKNNAFAIQDHLSKERGDKVRKDS